MQGMDSIGGHMSTKNESMALEGNNSLHMPMMDMKMYFNFALPIRVLFYGWNVVNENHLAGSCFGVFLFAVLYEGLKVFRQRLTHKMRSDLSSRLNVSDDSSLELLREKRSNTFSIFNKWHILQSLLQIVQTTSGMLLMLVYMTFNVWLAVSVSLGSGVGYYIFAWSQATTLDFGDHCQ